MAPPFAEQPVFVLLDEVGGKLFKGDGTVAGEAEKTVQCTGYQDNQPSHEEAFEKLLGRIHPGAIVLLHSTSSTNAEILDELLTKWEEMGYHFGSLDDLIKAAAS